MLKLIAEKIIRTFTPPEINWEDASYSPQQATITINPRIGPNKNIVNFLIESLQFSLINNLAASASGCLIPKITNLLGPFR